MYICSITRGCADSDSRPPMHFYSISQIFLNELIQPLKSKTRDEINSMYSSAQLLQLEPPKWREHQRSPSEADIVPHISTIIAH